MKLLCIILTIITITITACKAQCNKKICLEFIKQIESAGDSLAYNKYDGGSRGLYQISPICLQLFNKLNYKNYTINDLFIVRINTEIAVWMIDVEIPYLLKHYKIPNTLENNIIAYNAGIAFLVYKWKTPKSTLNYIEKYKKLIKNRKIPS